MTAPERFDRRFASALDDLAEPRFPDYFDDILRVTERTSQRPAWSFPERWLPMSVIALPRPAASSRSWRPVLLLALLAVVLAAGAVLVGSQRSLPEPFGPARNGLLAYGSGGDIHLRNPSDGSSRVLVAGVSHDLLPEFSPDGTKLLFLREEVSGRNRIFVVDLDEGQPVEVSPAPLFSLSWWAWSPDSSQIAFSSMIKGYPQITVTQADGSGAVTLDLGTPADQPAWRPPDGRQLVVRVGTGSGDPDLAIVNADGTDLQRLDLPRAVNNQAYEFLAPAWSPDGARIAYHTLHQRDIFRRHVVNADGTNDRLLTTADDNVNETNNFWSPDGTHLAFERFVWDQVEWIGVARADGKGPTIDVSDRVPIVENVGTSLVWAPDGKSLVGHHEGSREVLDIDASTGEHRPAGWQADDLPSYQRLAP